MMATKLMPIEKFGCSRRLHNFELDRKFNYIRKMIAVNTVNFLEIMEMSA
jgi:hypothetical protein